MRVRHESDWYAIPAEAAGESMMTLTLVSQLIGLHKDAADVPATGTVRLLGR